MQTKDCSGFCGNFAKLVRGPKGKVDRPDAICLTCRTCSMTRRWPGFPLSPQSHVCLSAMVRPISDWFVADLDLCAKEHALEDDDLLVAWITGSDEAF